LAADHHGDAIAVWQGGSVSNQVTDFAVWKATRGAWSNPGAIPKGAGDWPQVAASPAGDATVVWAGGSGVRAISRPISGCCWSVPQTIGLSGANLQVVVDRAGDALVSSDQGSPEVSFRPGPTGVWGPPAAVSSSSGFSTHTAMTALGQAVAVWLQQGNLEAATYSGGN
jgi:hypothetical protein